MTIIARRSGGLRDWPLWLGAQLVFSVLLAIALFVGHGWALSDVTFYYQWSGEVVNGRFPYRDFFFDYPPLALPILLAPHILVALSELTYGSYLVLFATAMVGLWIILWQVIRRALAQVASVDVRPALRRQLILMALSLPILLVRYDLWPILLTALAFLAAIDRRPALSGAWLGLGIAAKLYPAVLVPIFAAHWWFNGGRRATTWHLAGVFVAALVAIGPFALLAPSGLLETLQFQQQRGLQIETAAGGLIQLINLISPDSLEVVHTGTYELVSDRVATYLSLQPLVAFGVLAITLVLGGYRVRLSAGSDEALQTLAAVATAVLLAFALTNRALSPQHVFWCLAFAAVLPGYRHWVLVAGIGLTVLIFPLLYEGLLAQQAMPVMLLNLRNGLLLILAAILVVRPVVSSSSRPRRFGWP